MDHQPCLSVDGTHPAVTACWRGGRVGKERDTPPTRQSTPCQVKCTDTARVAGSASASHSQFTHHSHNNADIGVEDMPPP